MKASKRITFPLLSMTVMAVVFLWNPGAALGQGNEIEGPPNPTENESNITSSTSPSPEQQSGDREISLTPLRITAHVFFWSGLGLIGAGIYTMSIGLSHMDTGGGIVIVGLLFTVVGITCGLIFQRLRYKRDMS